MEQKKDVPSPQPPHTHFYMSAKLDTTRINRDVQQLVDEIISHLVDVEGSVADVRLEVNVNAPNGFSPPVVRVVSENCNTMKINDYGFDK